MDLQITIDATPEEARAELARWLDSGEYDQTKGVLCRLNEEGVPVFCCMGVASEIGVALGLVTKTEHEDHYMWFDYDGEQATLGYKLQGFFGMSSTGRYRSPHLNAELVNDNDHRGHKFSQIAATVRSAEFIFHELE